MKRSGGMVVLALSIVAGLLAAVFAVSLVQQFTKTRVVLVAVREIAPFTPLSADMFAAQQMPAAAIPADAITDPAAIRGRYARAMLLQGTVVRQGHLARASGDTGSLAARLTETGQPGTRALAIPVDNATGVGGTLQAGDRVEIIAAVRVEREKGAATTFSKIIARNVPVLYRTEADGTAKATVVVQVTPQMAEEIAYAQLAGTIYLATMPYKAEAELEKTQGVTPDSFIQKHSGGR